MHDLFRCNLTPTLQIFPFYFPEEWEYFFHCIILTVSLWLTYTTSLNLCSVFVCARTHMCGMCAVIELRPGHEMCSFSCAKRADLLLNWLGTCQLLGS